MTIDDAEVTAELWRRGVLTWKLQPHQPRLYEAASSSTALVYCVKCARRFGKTTCLCLYSLEFAIQNPGAQIRFAAPTAKQLRKSVLPIMRGLLADCPEDVRPRWHKLDDYYSFGNGSELHMAGSDNGHAESLRGTASHLNIVDEAGFCDELDYLVNDILVPQTLTTQGRTILISTPPKTPAHDFTDIAAKAAARGNLIKLTINDNTSISEATRRAYAAEAGGETSTTWRREYLCEDVVDEESAVIPEFTEEAQAVIVQEPEPLGYHQPLVSLDIGFEDLSFALFGYYHFAHATLCIQDEVVMQRMTTDDLAGGIKGKEVELWGPKDPERDDRVSRWSDTDLIVIHDLNVLHGLYFQPTAKDNKEAQVNLVRMWTREKRIRISPRCKQLIHHMRTAVWNKQRTGFERTKSAGHFDGVDALIYMARNAPIHTNPYPVLAPDVKLATHWINPQPEANQTVAAIKGMLRRVR